MSQPTREQVSIALFNLLSTSFAYPTKSRRMKLWDTIATVQKPALLIEEEPEVHSRNTMPTPAIRTLEFTAYIFVQTDPSIGDDKTLVPITQLNNILDAIDPVSGGVLKPDDTAQNRQTLGGLVYDCYIEGIIKKIPGDLDNQGVMTIPIKVIFNR